MEVWPAGPLGRSGRQVGVVSPTRWHFAATSAYETKWFSKDFSGPLGAPLGAPLGPGPWPRPRPPGT